ncbi:MAG: hypothetical protein IH934_06615 [Nanoarchaeota archaeon]|nr:hypothetical protein [Nanoarchaeota archaeon]
MAVAYNSKMEEAGLEARLELVRSVREKFTQFVESGYDGRMSFVGPSFAPSSQNPDAPMPGDILSYDLDGGHLYGNFLGKRIFSALGLHLNWGNERREITPAEIDFEGYNGHYLLHTAITIENVLKQISEPLKEKQKPWYKILEYFRNFLG